ncbi:extensin family protein [Loktanella agnita]|uniref:extensin-like domain-containing protein n=1 Tax=Loktanella agnita TaxID=287097 RepID=UPI003987ACA0
MMLRAGLLACLVTAPLAAQDIRPVARSAAPQHAVTWSEDGLKAIGVAPLAFPQQTPAALRPDHWDIVAPASYALRPEPRPYERPYLAHGAQTRALYRAEQNLFAYSPYAILRSLRPQLRPASVAAAAQARRIARRRGQVCGDPAIQGEALGPVAGAGACGIDQAVRVRSVSGVTLTPRATMDCQTATALKSWVQRGVRPAIDGQGGGAASLRVVSHYACRNRNNQSGARLSEHAYGRAIDIAGIKLQDGREITVLSDWGSAAHGAQLRRIWRAACGIFGTVLGPEANRFHRDHFHFDTARYRSGSYCR